MFNWDFWPVEKGYKCYLVNTNINELAADTFSFVVILAFYCQDWPPHMQNRFPMTHISGALSLHPEFTAAKHDCYKQQWEYKFRTVAVRPSSALTQGWLCQNWYPLSCQCHWFKLIFDTVMIFISMNERWKLQGCCDCWLFLRYKSQKDLPKVVICTLMVETAMCNRSNAALSIQSTPPYFYAKPFKHTNLWNSHHEKYGAK